MQYTWQEITAIIMGEAVTADSSMVLTQPGYDTRRLGNHSSTLFFALPGTHRKGAEFIHIAAAAGVRSFVVPQD
ncbi:MAG: hypothetical protein ACKO6I_09000, partial [Sphingomonadales bacterium]